jgi:hypothetical protein
MRGNVLPLATDEFSKITLPSVPITATLSSELWVNLLGFKCSTDCDSSDKRSWGLLFTQSIRWRFSGCEVEG